MARGLGILAQASWPLIRSKLGDYMTRSYIAMLFLILPVWAEQSAAAAFEGAWAPARVEVQCLRGGRRFTEYQPERLAGTYIMFDCSWGPGSYSYTGDYGHEPNAYRVRSDGAVHIYMETHPKDIYKCDRESFRFIYDVKDKTLHSVASYAYHPQCDGSGTNAVVKHVYRWDRGCF
jgi:hypothetical protein